MTYALVITFESKEEAEVAEAVWLKSAEQDFSEACQDRFGEHRGYGESNVMKLEDLPT